MGGLGNWFEWGTFYGSGIYCTDQVDLEHVLSKKISFLKY